ncbi:MAG: chromate transporter [Chloroflexia bacterium]|nr:chromate transporter [Chloroflexia bacterium]
MLRLSWLLFVAFLKVGAFGYGGGPSMIPLLQQEIVEVYQDDFGIDDEEFIDALAMGNTLPGPITIKMAVYIGYRVAGVPGAVAALVGLNLPCIVAMALLSLVYLRIKDHPKVTAALQGARPAVIGLLAWTAYDLGKGVLVGDSKQVWRELLAHWDRALLAVGAFVAVTFLKIHPALVILAAAVLGFIIY